ncbi:carbohydrate ABC transporter permease [Cohnella soli]|uniref:Carbohydrate ABC transporter permease n=1 Tax=Cohnella soli TaxID=425005 RepID=A0ABW0I0V7_9BACL
MQRLSEAAFQTLNYLLFTCFMLLCIYPFYYIFIYSISDPAEAAKGLLLLPKGVTFQSYSSMFQLDNIKQAFVVSTLRTIVGTAVTVFCCTMFGYVLTKDKMILRKTFYRILIATMYLNAGLIPWYLTMKAYSLGNSFLLYILPSAIVAFYVVLIKTFMEQLPAALEESAMMDGAGYPTIFFKIVFPLSIPIVATIAVFCAVNQWNTWTDNYFLVSTEKLQTLQLTLLHYLRESESIASQSTMDLTRQGSQIRITPSTIRMTITMIVTLPILLVYPFLQRYFVKGIMLGAVKG